MSEEKMREAFERVVESKFGFDDNDFYFDETDSTYNDPDLNDLWIVYQAALQESEVGAVDAQNIPLNAIGRMLSEVMETAISNGANSVSMPDHYVEVAAWLSNVKPSAPKYAQAIETAAIMKCADLMVKRGVLSTDGLNYEALLALIPQDGRTQLEEFGVKVADGVSHCIAENRQKFAWATFDGEGSYDLRLYQDNENYRDEYIRINGEKYASWVIPLYAATSEADKEKS